MAEVGETVKEMKSNGSTKGSSDSEGFKSQMEHYMYNGEKKHVFVGISIIIVLFGVPWYLINRGTKHQFDYLEKDDKAMSDRFSSSSPSAK